MRYVQEAGFFERVGQRHPTHFPCGRKFTGGMAAALIGVSHQGEKAGLILPNAAIGCANLLQACNHM